MGFFLEDDNLGERLAHNITLFLSALALLYVVGQDLPKTTFLTSIDRIVVVTLVLIFVTSLHFVFLKKLAEESVSSMPLTKHDYKIVLPYFFGYMAYLILEFLYLLFRRHIQCKEFQKNLNKDRVFLDGIDEHNKNVQEDLTYKMPAEIMIDPFRMVLVKKKDSRALFLPQLLTKVAVPVQLLLPSSGKAVVMSSRPEFQHEGNDVQWMTLGSPIRALEVVFDTDQCIKWASRREQVFTVVDGKYEVGQEVLFYQDLKEDFQKFKSNSDGTLSPIKAPDLVIGMEATSGS